MAPTTRSKQATPEPTSASTAIQTGIGAVTPNILKRETSRTRPREEVFDPK